MTQHELDEIEAAWLRALPGLLEQHPVGSWAMVLPKPFKILGVYPDQNAAMTAGYTLLEEGHFMVQEVKPVEPHEVEWLAQRNAAETEYASWHWKDE